MKNKLGVVGVAVVFLVIMGGYFLLNPSYEKSLKAKYYYQMGDYEYALTLAEEAFNLNLYNRMAATIMAQSKASLKFVSYNDDAKKYMQEINTIASQEFITDGDKAKIRTMATIVVSSYKKLAPSTVIADDLKDEALEHYNDFEDLLEKVDK